MTNGTNFELGRSGRFGIAAIIALTLATLGGCSMGDSNPAGRVNQPYIEGAIAYQKGDRERAARELQAAVADNPDLIMARFLLGNIYREKGDYNSAAQQYKRVAELDPYVYTNHYNLGLMYHLLNRLQEAVNSYARALRLNPQDLRSNMNLALAYTALGKADAGLPYARRAVEVSPDSAEAHANLGVVLDALRRYPEAEGAYRRSLELDSNQVETALNLAANLTSQKKPREAAAVYEQTLKKADSAMIRQRYGYALLWDGRYDEAVRQFATATRQDARNYQALNGTGEALIAQYKLGAQIDEQKRTTAIDCWRKSLTINPNQPRIASLVQEYSTKELFVP